MSRAILVTVLVLFFWPSLVPTMAQDTPESIGALRIDADSDWYPDRLGELVTTEGVVTYEAYQARGGDETRAYLQDQTGAIRLLSFDAEILQGLRRWDRIRVRGTLDEDRGLELLIVEEVTVLAAGEPLRPLELSLQALAISAEAYVGRLVRVKGYPELYDDDLYLNDGVNRLRLYIRDSISNNEVDGQLLALGHEIVADGFLEQNDGDVPPVGNYRLTPRSLEDVVQTAPSRIVFYLKLVLGVSLVTTLLLLAYARLERRRTRQLRDVVERLQQSELALRERERQLTEEIEVRKSAEQARQKAELRLFHAQKMESLGTLAGGIAHDLNNILTVILGRADAIVEDRRVAERVRESATHICNAAERAAQLIRQVLAFSRRQTLALETVGLAEIVEANEELIRSLTGEDVVVLCGLSTKSVVRVDSTQLTQVLVNLVSNARDAMPRGGELTIRAFDETLGEPLEIPSGSVPPGRYGVLEVVDSGVGMDATTLTRVFDPFYTTKGPGEGTGLGLATVHGIIAQSGGFACIQSQIGAGTAVRIYLPAVNPAIAEPIQKGRIVASADSLPHLGTVLFAEDDDEVRRVTAGMLGEWSDRVLEARDAQEAESLWSTHREEITLLVTDVIMPGGSGVELARSLSRERPDLKILFVSGYPSGRLTPHLTSEMERNLLMKPLNREKLAAKLVEMGLGRKTHL